MAGVALLISAPVGYLLRYVGRVKLLLPVLLVMTSLLLTVLLLDESRSRDLATYLVIGCAWSVCDCCAHICLTGAPSRQRSLASYAYAVVKTATRLPFDRRTTSLRSGDCRAPNGIRAKVARKIVETGRTGRLD